MTVAPTMPPPAVSELDQERANTVQLVSAGLLFALPPSPSALPGFLFWNHGIGWLDLGLALGMYIFTGLGLSVCFHRSFSHRSFVPPAG